MDKTIHSCNDHIEELLDVFLDETSEMPLMEGVMDSEIMCRECPKIASYKLVGSEVKAKWE